MSKTYLLYNPIAGNGQCRADVETLANAAEDAVLIDVKNVRDYAVFFAGMDTDDRVIVCGGDGTVNHFVNDVRGLAITQKIYYYPVGSGNDFARDIGMKKGAAPDICINDIIQNLPLVSVNGVEKAFINGVGYGIDGYCCEVGDAMRAKNDGKPIDYTMIAIKGLLFHYKPTNATVTVDGKRYSFKKVWIAPTMHGRFYGGGMMPTPAQDRFAEDKQLSLMVFHSTGKLRTLMIFPSLFKGEHVKHEKAVTILTGKEITVTFDRPAPLQIDGETVLGVTSYTARAHATEPATV